MKNDYDIVIIGGDIAGYKAALAANQLQAKVALVQPQINYEFDYNYSIKKLSVIYHNYQEISNLGIVKYTENTKENIQENTNLEKQQNDYNFSYKKSISYAQNITDNFNQINSLSHLATQGIDIIIGSGKFTTSGKLNSGKLNFAVNDRNLKSRTYILACGSYPYIPDIEGLQTTGYLTLANIWRFLQTSNLPNNWVIIGGLPQSIEIAQTLARLGCTINLILNDSSVLSRLEPEISQLLIAVLEANGVQVFNNVNVSQVRRIEDKKWVQVGNKAIETEEILVATAQQPNIENLNLAAIGVKWYPRRLVVNKKLQTTHQQIYACGDVIGGYHLPSFANYEAKIAVKNALFFNNHTVNYNCVPWIINTHPMVAKVGLTAQEAQTRYGKNEVLVFQNYYKTLTAAQINNEITGVCKLVTLKNGEILGCSILGTAAEELINLVALAISQNIKIQNLEKLTIVDPSFTEIISQIAEEWHQQKLHQNHFLQEFLQSFYHFRRDWNI
ncbi:MAG: NAD(P)/FAD-dependent oxidoreductase [Nostocales cyanobacterium]|nr:MAG: NAD(P)/FAD-dependent oxidoreductase [Nostocales cyanobacterium]TAF16634.1 MAG: NAD(P)/FAD-dependent oxidoreductase [Nostocales cyanobacterium]